MYAVIKTGGKQYRVAPDDVLTIEKVKGDAGAKIEFADVLMIGGSEAPKFGTPLVSGAKVVYLAFGFEAIDNAADREDVMRGALFWLKDILFRDGFESGDMGAWSVSTP